MAQIQIDDEFVGTTQVNIETETTPNEIHQRGVSTVLGAIDKDEDPANAYIQATQNQDLQGMLDQWNETTTQDRMAIIQNQLAFSSSEEINQDVTDLASNLDGPINQGNYIETIRALPSSVGKSEEQIQKEAIHMQLRETMANFTPRFEDMEIGEIASSIGGLLIPKRHGVAMSKLLTDMGFIDDTFDQLDAFIDPTEEIVKLRNVFWNSDDQGQIEFMNILADSLPRASDNPFIRSEIINSILGGEFDEDTSTLFATLDTVDLGLLSTAVVQLGKGIARSGKLLNYSKRTGEHDLSADMIKAATDNPEIAAKVGITQADIGDAVNPLIHKDMGELLTGAPDDVAANIKSTIDVQDARFKAITDDIDRNGILDRDGVNDAMRSAELEQLRQPGVIEATVNQFDETGFKLTWTEAYFDSLGRLRRKTASKDVDFTVNDIGEIKAPVDEWVNSWLALDPNAKSTGKLRQWFVSDVETLARKQEMTAKAFDNMMRDAFKGLKKKGAANVDHALQRGARDGKTYNFDELVSGVTGRDLTTKEAQAYIATRNVVEKLYVLKNKQIVDNLLAQGTKLYDGPEGIMPVRDYTTWQSANTAWKQVGSDSHHILVPDGGLRLKGVAMEDGLMPFKRKSGLTKAMLQEAYDKGFILSRNHSASRLFKRGDQRTQWAFVKANKISSPRGKQVIHRIEGYMPKQRTGAFFFIKKNKNMGLSGAPDHKALNTQAYSDTEEGALAWKAKQDNPDEFEIVFDRQLTETERLYDTASTHGGMYAGARKETELPFVGDGDATFADSFEALQHYINHIGRQYPASLYRIGSEQRLIKIANDLGIKSRGLNLNNVLERASEKLATTSKEFKMLKGLHDQISFVNMIPTQAEADMAARWRTIGKMFEGPIIAKVPIMKNAPKFFYQKAAKNQQPPDVIRGITFNHLLGMYNPAQIIVQASGSLVSFAIDPVGFPKAVSRMFGWGMLDLKATDPLMQGKMIKWMKSNGLSEYADEYELWTKSGFRESIEQGNADYTSVFTKNLPYDAGIWRKAAANHTVFYKMGELANTRAAFATSIARYKKVHNVKNIDPNSAEALDELGLWAEKYRLNMSRANQSDLNKGWKAVPFQFQQIISKYFEKILPQAVGGTDEFTSWEKARLFAIPTIATGAVGIPMGQFVVTQTLDMLGIDETDLTEEETLAVKHGMIGWMNSEMLNLNVNFSDRMTLGGDVIRNIYESLVTGKATWQWLGASGTVGDRYWRNMQYLSEALDLTVLKNDDITFQDIQAIPAILAEATTDIPTVTRNIKQYYAHIFSDNPQFIKDGKYMWDWETMNAQTAFFGTMGFQPTEVTEMYELNKEINDSPLSFSVWGDTDADVILRIINTRLLTGETIREKELYSKVINSMLKKYGPVEQMKLIEAIWNKTTSRQFDQNNLIYKMWLEAESRQQTDLNILNSLAARKIEEQR